MKIGEELYEKLSIDIINENNLKNIKNELTSNAKQQIEKIKKSQDEFNFSILYGPKELSEVRVNEIKSDEIIFDVVKYDIIEIDETGDGNWDKQELEEIIFEKAFKIKKIKGEWIIDSIMCDRVKDDEVTVIRLSNEEKININSKLLNLSSIMCMDTLWSKAYDGNVLDSDKAKYEFILLIEDFSDEDTVKINNGSVLESYIELSKFQKYAKKYYIKELNTKELNDYIYKKEGVTYIKVSLEKLSKDYAIKAGWIVENKTEKNKTVVVNLIDPYQNRKLTSNKGEKLFLSDSLEYDSSMIKYRLIITYATNPKTQENYLISISCISPAIEE